MLPLRRGSWLWVLTAALFSIGACKGDTGEQGPEGPPGEPGPPGETPGGGIEPAPLGLVGRVIEPNLLPVPGGTVYLVPAADVEALSDMPIDIFLSPEDTAALPIDEPIEDLLDENADSYEKAEVDSSGTYRFETLPEEGRYFVVWAPAADDAQHLPGGDSSSVSFDTASLVGMQLDIRVSSQPGSSATYVGSSTCMVCHGLHSTTRTAHNVGLQVPGVRSILQDVEPWPNFDDALALFDTNATTLFYYDCDPEAPNPSKCKVDAQDPGAGVSFEVGLRRDDNLPLGVVGAYYVEMVAGANTQRYDVVLTYGGAVGKQQYLTRRENADGSLSYFVLPVQYNYEGDTTNDSSDDWPWRDYRSDLWFDGGAFTQPGNAESFDNNCAGCHMTGYRLDGSAADGWAARAAVDSDGAFDYDGDGRLELINTGCESCHGPGSDHVELSPRGSYIVSPGSLTPGRQAALCGSCHSRPLGIGGGETGLPLSAANEMPPPGIRRARFAADHTTRVSGSPEAFFDAADPQSADARANYQQYSGHIRSKHYRNSVRLTSCTGCHSPHANSADISAMDMSENQNALCTTCHSPEANPELYPLTGHVETVTGVTAHSGFDDDAFRCTDCHMVPTAKSGAANKQLDSPVQYYWNDIASHRMVMTRWRDVTVTPDRPVAFTNECGVCHSSFLTP